LQRLRSRQVLPFKPWEMSLGVNLMALSGFESELFACF
jgi:hypothetical protein